MHTGSRTTIKVKGLAARRKVGCDVVSVLVQYSDG